MFKFWPQIIGGLRLRPAVARRFRRIRNESTRKISEVAFRMLRRVERHRARARGRASFLRASPPCSGRRGYRGYRDQRAARAAHTEQQGAHRRFGGGSHRVRHGCRPLSARTFPQEPPMPSRAAARTGAFRSARQATPGQPRLACRISACYARRGTTRSTRLRYRIRKPARRSPSSITRRAFPMNPCRLPATFRHAGGTGLSRKQVRR